MPGLADVAAVEAEQFANVASAQITLDQWLALARRLNALFRDDPSLSGIVVTSGTDTLEELAYFLHLTVRDRRPVVVTGSMRNPSQVGYEGPANLLASVRVAADARAAGRGVLVVLNDEINGARDVTKTDALRLQHLRSRAASARSAWWMPIGSCSAGRPRAATRRARSSTSAASRRCRAWTSSSSTRARLAICMKAAVDLGARGIVLATAGAGATSGTQGEGLAYAREKGVPVVATTRAGSGPHRRRPRGRLRPADAAQRASPAAISAGEGRVLLMLGLTRTSDVAELQRMFEEYCIRLMLGTRDHERRRGTAADARGVPTASPCRHVSLLRYAEQHDDRHDDRGDEAGHQVHRDGQEREAGGHGHAVGQHRRERRHARGDRGGQAADHVQRRGDGEARATAAGTPPPPATPTAPSRAPPRSDRSAAGTVYPVRPG